ncbi:N-acyl homoserine lactonase family protein [Citricoccus sp. NPDC055426]|uniref:N-acyl homoserine lactonase family protein n=1 Tax=Citricoccus sp. NPDC055426 TaxID=3155536 RepID=UPI0034249B56
MAERFEVLAFRYGRLRTEWNQLFVDEMASRSGQTEMAYYFWLAFNDERLILIDTGFHPAVGQRRGRELLIEPLAALQRAGVHPDDITDVILTHFHYDHIGNAREFKKAHFYTSEAEYDYWVTQNGLHNGEAPVESDELAVIEGIRAEGRLTLLPAEAPSAVVGGIRSLPLRGHTPGQIGLQVPTRGAPVFLTSDAAHTQEEIERDAPFHVFTDLRQMKQSMAAVRAMVDRQEHILVLGHEKSVAEDFPLWRSTDGIYQVSPVVPEVQGTSDHTIHSAESSKGTGA